MQRVVPSRRFIQALKLHPHPAYRIAWRGGVHPNTLSKLTSGYLRTRVGDPRVIAVGKELGLTPAECFDVVEEPAEEIPETRLSANRRREGGCKQSADGGAVT